MKNLQSLTLSLAFSALTFASNAQAKFYYGASINAQQSSYKNKNATIPSFVNAFSIHNTLYTQTNGTIKQEETINFFAKHHKSENDFLTNQVDNFDTIVNETTISEMNDLFFNNNAFMNKEAYTSYFLQLLSGNEGNFDNSIADGLIKNKKFVKIGDYYYANFGKEEHGGMTLESLKEVHNTLVNNDKDTINNLISEQNQNNMWADIKKNQIDFARTEHANINDSASKNNISGSLLLGYTMKNIGGFNPTLEASLDFGSLKAGNNKQNELEIKHNYSINLLSRIGYSFIPNNSAYINLGVAFTKYNIKFVGLSIYDIDVNKFTTSGVLGVGYEIAFKNKYRIFSEVNYKTSLKAIKTPAGDVDANEVQFKIGLRFDF